MPSNFSGAFRRCDKQRSGSSQGTFIDGCHTDCFEGKALVGIKARSGDGVVVGSYNFEDFNHALLDLFDGHSSMLVDKPLQWWQKKQLSRGHL